MSLEKGIQSRRIQSKDNVARTYWQVQGHMGSSVKYRRLEEIEMKVKTEFQHTGALLKA